MCTTESPSETLEPATQDHLAEARRQLLNVTVDNVWNVPSKSCYRYPEFLSLLFGRVERLRLVDVEEAWALGEVLPVLVEKIPFESDPEGASWMVRTLALAGELADLSGRGHQAEAFLKQAVDAYSDNVAPIARAELFRRRTARALRSGCVEDGKVFVARSIATYRELVHFERDKPRATRYEESEMGLAEALFLDGILHDEPVSFSESLYWGLPGEHSGGVVFDAVLTAVADRMRRPLTEDQAEDGNCRLFAGQQRSLGGVKSDRKTSIVWSASLVIARLGLARLAQRRYRWIFEYFEERAEDPYHAGQLVLCALDYADGLRCDEETAKATELLDRTATRLKSVGADPSLSDLIRQAQNVRAVDLGDLRRRTALDLALGVVHRYPILPDAGIRPGFYCADFFSGIEDSPCPTS